MPELKHGFGAAKMNKDADERIVPNGEYRDALNIEIVTSESSDTGSMQTLLGNIKLSTNIKNTTKKLKKQAFCYIPAIYTKKLAIPLRYFKIYANKPAITSPQITIVKLPSR